LGEDFHRVGEAGEREGGEGAWDEGEDCLEDWSKEEGAVEEDRRAGIGLPSLPSQ